MSGDIQLRIISILGGVLVLIFGLILADVVIDSSVTALTNAAIGSFAGASAVGGLIPFVYFAAILGIAVGLMAVGFGGFVGKGPMAVWVLPLVGMVSAYPLAFITAGVMAIYIAYYFQSHRMHRLAPPQQG